MTETQPSQVPEHTGGFRPREYAHIVLKTGQPEALIDWYCTVLGAQVVVRHDIINFLSWDDSQDRLAILPIENAEPPAPNSTGLHHAAFTIGSLRELCDQYRCLRDQGIEPVQAFNHGVATSMYYEDPDGNQIELTVEAFRTLDELNDWLATGLFDINPVGVIIDPEELCRRLDNGEDEVQILEPHPDHNTWLADTLGR